MRVDTQEIDRFLQRLSTKAKVVRAASCKLTTIPEAAKSSRSTTAAIVGLLLGGKLNNVEMLEGASGYLAVMIDPREVRKHYPVVDENLSPGKDEAAKLLGMRSKSVDVLTDNSCGPPILLKEPGCKHTGVKYRISMDEIERFRKTYVTLGQLAKGSGWHFILVRSTLANSGIRPCIAPEILGIWLYLRCDASGCDIV